MPLPVGSYTQVAYVVNDLDATLDRWGRTVGAGPFYLFSDLVEDVVYRGQPGTGTSRAAMGFLGATNLEFFQPTNDAPSMYREILETRGESIHHTLPSMRPFTPSEFDALCAHYDAAGLPLVVSGVVPTVGRIRFYDAGDVLGQFIEAIELSAEAYAGMDRMYDEHIRWDRVTNPVRPFAELFAP